MLSAATIFLSAFLLFGVQPLIARQITPWFGGSAAVWTTCMLFFQVVLLLGYFYAHLAVSRLPALRQARLHQVLAVLSLLSLPIIPGAMWKPGGGEEPTLRVLLVLAASVGLPYWTLSTTNPLLGAWFSRRYTEAQSYRLFALSNAGALLALLSYPTLVEPRLTLRQQALGWSLLYAIFVVLVSIVAQRSRAFYEAPNPSSSEPGEIRPSSWFAGPLGWIGLSASSSVLLLALTNYLSQNIAAIPFLWVAPLALYLLSFIFCFSYSILYQRWLFWPLALLSLYYMGENLSGNSYNQGLATLIPLICLSLFSLCMLFHGELARSKPEAARLTQYYLMISLGGALGGIFVGVLSPLIFAGTYELPLVLWLSPLLAAAVVSSDARLGAIARRGLPLFWLALGVFLIDLARRDLPELYAEEHGCKIAVRNFYGPLKVEELGTGAELLRRLTHGTIQHGCQFLEPGRRRFATSYYAKESGVGQAIFLTRTEGQEQRVGIVGLGTGTVASYGRRGDAYVYYEINPLVEKLARQEFTYLSDNPAKTEVVLGDARLSLEKESPREFDVLAVDAFSSDSIPIHLLTQEALALYFRHLKPSGLLAVHISNRYLDLQPVLRSYADINDKATIAMHNEADDDNSINGSTWILLGSRDNAALKGLHDDGNSDAEPVPASFRPWTDNYSNLFSVIDPEELASFRWTPTSTPSPTPAP